LIDVADKPMFLTRRVRTDAHFESPVAKRSKGCFGPQMGFRTRQLGFAAALFMERSHPVSPRSDLAQMQNGAVHPNLRGERSPMHGNAQPVPIPEVLGILKLSAMYPEGQAREGLCVS